MNFNAKCKIKTCAIGFITRYEENEVAPKGMTNCCWHLSKKRNNKNKNEELIFQIGFQQNAWELWEEN